MQSSFYVFAASRLSQCKLVNKRDILYILHSSQYPPDVRAVEGLMYLAPACSFWLLLGVATVEWPRMAEEDALSLIANKPLLYLLAAAMGFGVNSLAYIVIQLASSLTLKVTQHLHHVLYLEITSYAIFVF